MPFPEPLPSHFVARRAPRTSAPARIALVPWLLLLAACAAPGPPTPRDTGQLVFWEIRAPGGATAHLLGTVHVARDADAFDPAVTRALARADTLVMEIDPEELDPDLVGQLLLQKGVLPAGRTLRDVVSPETWALLEERIAAEGISPEQVLPMEPWVVLLTLLNSDLAAEGYAPERGVERRLLARGAELPVVALESASFQVELFDALSFAQQERMLRGFLETSSDPEGARAGLELLMDAWRLGDLEALQVLGMPEHGEDPDADALYDVLYRQRNHAMAARLDELLRGGGGPWFVMIGALHTVGEEGVPALLEERGHEVRRVPRSATPAGLGHATEGP